MQTQNHSGIAIKVYLDNCCFNRPYDNQSHLRIRLESEAKLKIQEEIRSGAYKLIWSYILDYENSKAGAGFFLTTDDGILKKAPPFIRGIHIADPRTPQPEKPNGKLA